MVLPVVIADSVFKDATVISSFTYIEDPIFTRVSFIQKALNLYQIINKLIPSFC